MDQPTTDTAQTGPAAVHPLDPVTSDEIIVLKAVLEAAGYKGDGVRYSYVLLREPTREDMAAFVPGDVPKREISVLVTDIPARKMTQIVVDMTTKAIVESSDLDPTTDGWGPVLDEEYELAGEICKADDPVCGRIGETRHHRSGQRVLRAPVGGRVRI